MKANWTDRLISAVSPGWAAKRAIARLRFELATERRSDFKALSTYEAAEKSRITADWQSKNKSADGAILRDQSVLMARARAAARDDWAGASIVGGHVRHIVATGITPKANARDPVTGIAQDEFNKAVDKRWKRWSRDPRLCDIEQKKTILDFQALAVRELVTVGEAFIILNYKPRPKNIGLVLQAFEPEQLDWNRATGLTSNIEVKNGIEVDEYGAIVAYWVYTKKHPYDSTAQSERIPADRVIHLMRPDRVRQTHGATWLAPVLTEMWHTKMYKTYTLLQAKFQACGGASIETQAGAGIGDIAGLLTSSTADEKDANLNKQMNLEPMMLWELGAGKTMKFHSPEIPAGQYGPFTKVQLTETAAGAGLDYPTVTRDFSGNTYSGQRQGMLETNAETDPEQLRLIDVMLQRIREQFILYGIKEGRFKAAHFDESEEWADAYMETDWRAAPKPWIDPYNQAQAAELLLRMRLANRRGIQNELGLDWREELQQTADEEAFAGGINVYLPEAQAPVASGAGFSNKAPLRMIWGDEHALSQ